MHFLCLLLTMFYLEPCLPMSERLPRYASSPGVRLGPSFHVTPRSSVLFSNDTGIVLDCAAHGLPLPTVHWERLQSNSISAISSDANTLIEVLTHNRSLWLRPFASHEFDEQVHRAKYRCVANSDSGRVVAIWTTVKAVLRVQSSLRVETGEATLGEPVLLRCRWSRAADNVLRIVGWQRNNRRIEANVRRPMASESIGHFVLANGDLVVASVTSADLLSDYSCIVENLVTGNEEYSRPKPLKQSQNSEQRRAPIFVTYPDNFAPFVSREKGEDAIIPCFVHGQPRPVISWFKEGPEFLLEPLPASEERVARINGALVIKHLRSGDSHSYRCVARNSLGESSHTTQLQVLPAGPEFDPEELQLEITPQWQKANLGAQAKLECKLKGFSRSQGLSMEWLKDGGPVKSQAKFETKNQYLLSTLVIDRVQKHDLGVYQCFVIDKGKQIKQTAAEIRMGDTSPSWQYTFIEQTLQPGPLVTLKCSATGNPTPRITWTLDNFALPSNERYMLSQYVTVHGDVISHLNISRVQTRDGGLYGCSANNRAGSVEHYGKLNIYGNPISRGFPKEGIKAVEGKNIRLQCPIAGFPIKRYDWDKDGSPIMMNGDPHRIPFPLNGTLVLFNVSKARDEGAYACRATDQKGNADNALTSLNVLVAPRIVPFSSPGALSRGDRLSLVCATSKGDTPMSIVWLKNDSQLESRNVDAFTSVLSIPVLEAELHNGRYTCRASNKAGSDQHSVHVTVHVPPELSPMHSRVLRAGVRARLLCGLTRGDLPVDFRWLHNDQSVDRKGISQPDDSSSLLTLVDVSEMHAGKFECRATNAAGHARQQVFITVKVPPKWVVRPADVDAVLHAFVELKCSAKGAPKPKIVWKRIKDASKNAHFSLVEPDKEQRLADNGSLIMGNVRNEHQGKYVCEVDNGVGQKLTHTANLRVQAPPEIERMSRSMSGVALQTTASNLDLAELVCRAKGDKPINVHWTKGGVDLLSSSDGRFGLETKLEEGLLVATLAIRKVEKRDEGTYTCRMSNPFGSDQMQVYLVVQEPPQPPATIRLSQIGSNFARLEWHSDQQIDAEVNLNNDEKEVSANDFTAFRQRLESQRLPLKGFVVQVAPKQTPWDLADESTSSFEVEATPSTARLVVRDLRPFTEYKVRVFAHNTLGKGPASLPIVFRTRGAQPEAKPRSVMASSSHSDCVGLSWEDPETDFWNGPLTAYKIGIKMAASKFSSYNWTEVERHDTSDLQLTLCGLQPNTHYELLLQAINAFGAGPAERVRCTTSADVPLVSAQNLACGKSSSSTLIVHFERPREELLRGELVNYTLFYQAVHHADPEGQIVIEEQGKKLEVRLEQLSSDSNFSIAIQAATIAGSGPITTPPLFCSTQLGAPRGVSDLRVTQTSDKSLVVSWPAPKHPIDHYTLYKRHRRKTSSSVLETSELQVTMPYVELQELQPNVYYQFWVTVSASGHTSLPSPILGHRLKDDLEEIMRPVIVSIPSIFSVVLGQDLSLDCYTLESNVVRKWLRTDNEGRSRLLRSSKKDEFKLKDVQREQEGNYSCHVSKDNSITHQVLVQDLPESPNIRLLSKSSRTITLKLSRNASEHFLPLLSCLISTKLVSNNRIASTFPLAPAKINQSVVIRGLKCGQDYELSAHCCNALGPGSESAALRVRTEGSLAVEPLQKWLWPTNESVRIDIFAFNDPICPLQSLELEYRAEHENHWTLGTRLAPVHTRRLSIKGLRPGTKYLFKLKMSNEAGTSRIERIVSTLDQDDFVHITVNDVNKEESNQVVLAVPLMAVLLVLLVGVVLILLVIVRRSTRAIFSSKKPSSSRGLSGKALSTNVSCDTLVGLPAPPKTEMPEAVYETVARVEQEESGSNLDEIHPYATFVMADQMDEDKKQGTVANRAMLILHEKSTLPLSDGRSSDPPYAVAVDATAPATNPTATNTRAIAASRRRRRRKQSSASRSSQLSRMRHEDVASSSETNDNTKWDPSPKISRKSGNNAQRQIHTNQYGARRTQRALQGTGAKSRGGIYKTPLDVREETSSSLSSSDGDDNADDDGDDKKIFVRRSNGQFVAVKPSQIFLDRDTSTDADEDHWRQMLAQIEERGQHDPKKGSQVLHDIASNDED